MVVTIKDVAQKAGVSTATVSHVINNTRYVAEDTKARVTQAMIELKYRPNSVARSLRSQKSKVIGFLAPLRDDDTSSQYFLDIAHGIESVISKENYKLIISNSNESANLENEQLEVFHTHFSDFMDGLIMAPTQEVPEKIEKYGYGNYPIVFIDRKPIDIKGNCVLVNNYDISYQAVQKFIDLGRKRIGFISGPLGISTSDQRLKAYKDVLETSGLKYDERLVKTAIVDYKAGYPQMEELYAEKVDAVFIANNTLAMGALKYLYDYQIKIPENLSIIVYDNYEWTKLISPSLTVIKQPAYEMGKLAAEILLKQIGQPTNDYQDYFLEAELIVRHSL